VMCIQVLKFQMYETRNMGRRRFKLMIIQKFQEIKSGRFVKKMKEFSCYIQGLSYPSVQETRLD
jgi:hypothetical protein